MLKTVFAIVVSGYFDPSIRFDEGMIDQNAAAIGPTCLEEQPISRSLQPGMHRFRDGQNHLRSGITADGDFEVTRELQSYCGIFHWNDN
jgi:hypothetical protein